MPSINPLFPHHEKGKEGKGRETYKSENYSSFTSNTKNKRNNAKYTKSVLSLLDDLVIAFQGGQADTMKSWSGLCSRQELSSGVH